MAAIAAGRGFHVVQCDNLALPFRTAAFVRCRQGLGVAACHDPPLTGGRARGLPTAARGAAWGGMGPGPRPVHRSAPPPRDRSPSEPGRPGRGVRARAWSGPTSVTGPDAAVRGTHGARLVAAHRRSPASFVRVGPRSFTCGLWSRRSALSGWRASGPCGGPPRTEPRPRRPGRPFRPAGPHLCRAGQLCAMESAGSLHRCSTANTAEVPWPRAGPAARGIS